MSQVSYKRGNILIYVIIGLLMSGLSTQVCEKIGVPTLPELLYIPLLFLVRKDFEINKKWVSDFALFSVIWFAILFFAIIDGRFSLASIITTAKAYLIMGLFVALLYNARFTPKLSLAIFVISFASVAGWALTVYLKFIGVFPMGYSFVTYGNMVAVSLAISFGITIYKKPIVLLLLIVIVVFISVASAIRRLILVSAVSIVISFIFNNIFVKRSFKTTLVLAVLAISFISMLPALESTIEDISPVLHHRIFDKTRNAAFDSDIAEDDVREDNFTKIWSDVPNLIIPHGFVSKQTKQDEKVGIFVDNPLYEVFYTLGLPVGILLLLIYLVRLKRLTLYCFKLKNINMIAILTPSIICFMLLFVDSTYLSWSYITPSTGSVLGLLFKFSKKKINYEDIILLPRRER